MASHWANANGGRAVRPRVGEATPPHPYKPLGLFTGSLPHRQETSCRYQELGPSVHFPLAAGPRSPHPFKPFKSTSPHSNHLSQMLWRSKHLQTSQINFSTLKPVKSHPLEVSIPRNLSN